MPGPEGSSRQRPRCQTRLRAGTFGAARAPTARRCHPCLGSPRSAACSVRLCRFTPLAARNVPWSLWDLCFFQPLTRADGLACCVRCCFKRAERNKIIRLGVSADFSDMFLRCCRRGGPLGPQPCAGVGSSKQSLPVLMRCGQPRWAQRCGEMSCDRRESPQSEDPASRYWFPELLCNPCFTFKNGKTLLWAVCCRRQYLLRETNSPSFDWE